MALIEARDISHVYFTEDTAIQALQHVHLTVQKGEFISFIGPSGCGKSTFLSILAKLLTPTFGELHTNPSNIGYMLQQDYLFPWKTIEENISLGLTLSGEHNPQAAHALLETIGLPHTAQLYPAQLSGGMRQRVALARTLATNPQILLLDEPFSALDFYSKLLLENFVAATLKKLQKTAILVTHDISEAIAMSDKIYLFSKRPGTITQTFLVPPEIRTLPPFDARNSPAFAPLFQLIWKELEQR
ncbi:MAG: ABC transporter ATP-binding protein [Solibacillus sp.]